jgi:hypothetical protein
MIEREKRQPKLRYGKVRINEELRLEDRNETGRLWTETE